jgi:hypothetical protein
MKDGRASFLLGPLDGLTVHDFHGEPALVLIPHPVALVYGTDLFAAYSRSEVGMHAWYCYTGSGPRNRYPVWATVLAGRDLYV